MTQPAVAGGRPAACQPLGISGEDAIDDLIAQLAILASRPIPSDWSGGVPAEHGKLDAIALTGNLRNCSLSDPV
jgi:hypothetical protein